MADQQGRGPYTEDGWIEYAAKRAHENGGSGLDVSNAASEISGKVSAAGDDLRDKIRDKMRRLFGSR